MTSDDFTERHSVNLGSATVCYRRTGQGPALVLLHGFPLSGLTWRNVVPALSAQFTCYALDLVGLGDSTSSDKRDFASLGQARLLEQALASLGVSSFALLGNDTGGWVARELALRDPGRVTGLALTNTEIPGHRPPWIPLLQTTARLPFAGYIFQQILASRLARRSPIAFGGCFDNRDLIDGEFFDYFIRPLISSPRRLSLAIEFLRQMRFQRLDEFRQLHAKLTMPVAFFWGTADPTFPEETARSMVSQFPNVTAFTPVPNGKVFFHEEQPETLATLMMGFLRNA